jgi:hypothetical protein
MRFVILKDVRIKDSEWTKLAQEFTDLVKQYTELTPTFFIEHEDYSDVPTFVDTDGDVMPTNTYFKTLTDRVYAKYGTWGTDSVVMLVHRDNWVFKGIWGTNKSNQYHQYHLHLCRFDNKNIANSLGTLYHEWMHSLDVLIKTHTGVDINTYFTGTRCFTDWDNTCVHGNRFKGCPETPYKYIKWKDNVDALAMIAPDLKKAYAKRKEMYYQPYVTALWQVVDVVRGLLNRKTINKK